MGVSRLSGFYGLIGICACSGYQARVGRGLGTRLGQIISAGLLLRTDNYIYNVNKMILS